MLIPLFTNNLLPIFLAASAGFFVGKKLEIDPRSLSRVVFFVFSPCLVFTLIANSNLNANAALLIFILAVFVVLGMGAITWATARFFKFSRTLTAAILITVMFPNAGNFGLSLNKFAFGDDVLAMASIFFVATNILVYTFGTVIASAGKASIKESLAKLYKYPTLYAVPLAFLFKQTGWALPVPIERSVSLLGQAAIPTMLILLGLQLQRIKLDGYAKALGVGLSLRLLVAPALAFGGAMILGLSQMGIQAGVSEAAMPTAVMATVLATEFDTEPAFVTAMVTLGTLLSPLTLTPLLALLGG